MNLNTTFLRSFLKRNTLKYSAEYRKKAAEECVEVIGTTMAMWYFLTKTLLDEEESAGS